MTGVELLPLQEINLPQVPPTKFERERAAFRRLLPGLLKDYRNKYVAIHEERVAGTVRIPNFTVQSGQSA
jgi:hypothetical protein